MILSFQGKGCLVCSGKHQYIIPLGALPRLQMCFSCSVMTVWNTIVIWSMDRNQEGIGKTLFGSFRKKWLGRVRELTRPKGPIWGRYLKHRVTSCQEYRNKWGKRFCKETTLWKLRRRWRTRPLKEEEKQRTLPRGAIILEWAEKQLERMLRNSVSDVREFFLAPC